MEHSIKRENLKSKIKEKGYSQRRLARVMGKSLNTLNHKINGESPFLFSEVVEICEILNITDHQEILDLFI